MGLSGSFVIGSCTAAGRCPQQLWSCSPKDHMAPNFASQIVIATPRRKVWRWAAPAINGQSSEPDMEAVCLSPRPLLQESRLSYGRAISSYESCEVPWAEVVAKREIYNSTHRILALGRCLHGVPIRFVQPFLDPFVPSFPVRLGSTMPKGAHVVRRHVLTGLHFCEG